MPCLCELAKKIKNGHKPSQATKLAFSLDIFFLIFVISSGVSGGNLDLRSCLCLIGPANCDHQTLGHTQLEGVFPHLQRLDQSNNLVRELSTQRTYIMDDLENDALGCPCHGYEYPAGWH